MTGKPSESATENQMNTLEKSLRDMTLWAPGTREETVLSAEMTDQLGIDADSLYSANSWKWSPTAVAMLRLHATIRILGRRLWDEVERRIAAALGIRGGA